VVIQDIGKTEPKQSKFDLSKVKWMKIAGIIGVVYILFFIMFLVSMFIISNAIPLDYPFIVHFLLRLVGIGCMGLAIYVTYNFTEINWGD